MTILPADPESTFSTAPITSRRQLIAELSSLLERQHGRPGQPVLAVVRGYSGHGKTWALTATRDLVAGKDPYWRHHHPLTDVNGCVPAGTLPKILWLHHGPRDGRSLIGSLASQLVTHAELLQAVGGLGRDRADHRRAVATLVGREAVRVVRSEVASAVLGNLALPVTVATRAWKVSQAIRDDFRILRAAAPTGPDSLARQLAASLRKACGETIPVVIAVDDLWQVDPSERSAFFTTLSRDPNLRGMSVTVVCTIGATQAPLLEEELQQIALPVQTDIHLTPMGRHDLAELCGLLRPDLDGQTVISLSERLQTPKALVAVLRCGGSAERMLEIARDPAHSSTTAVYDALWSGQSREEQERLRAWLFVADAAGWRNAHGPAADAPVVQWFWSQVCEPSTGGRLQLLRELADGSIVLADPGLEPALRQRLREADESDRSRMRRVLDGRVSPLMDYLRRDPAWIEFATLTLDELESLPRSHHLLPFLTAAHLTVGDGDTALKRAREAVRAARHQGPLAREYELEARSAAVIALSMLGRDVETAEEVDDLVVRVESWDPHPLARAMATRVCLEHGRPDAEARLNRTRGAGVTPSVQAAELEQARQQLTHIQGRGLRPDHPAVLRQRLRLAELLVEHGSRDEAAQQIEFAAALGAMGGPDSARLAKVRALLER